MTRKDYFTIARVVAKITGAIDRALVTEAFIEECKRDNPRFDEHRFRNAILKERQA